MEIPQLSLLAAESFKVENQKDMGSGWAVDAEMRMGKINSKGGSEPCKGLPHGIIDWKGNGRIGLGFRKPIIVSSRLQVPQISQDQQVFAEWDGN